MTIDSLRVVVQPSAYSGDKAIGVSATVNGKSHNYTYVFGPKVTESELDYFFDKARYAIKDTIEKEYEDATTKA